MNKLYAGFGRVNITPMMGINISGYYQERIADGVLDDLEANALALSCGDKKAVVISCDLLYVPLDVAKVCKADIMEATGLSEEAIFLHGTHTHTGPVLKMDSEKPLEQEYIQ